MKKQYKLSKDNDEVDSYSEELKELYISDEEGVWLDTGEETIQLPPEIVKYLESDGILGIA